MTDNSRIALVTGGNRGIGRAVVENLAKHGVDSIFTYRSHKDEASGVVDSVAVLGRRAVALELDTGRVETFESFADRVRTAPGEHWNRDRLDFLVNNAGTSSAGTSIADTTEEMFDRVVNVNFKGLFFITQTLVPLITDGGRIINVGSSSTRYAAGPVAAYAAAKSAVEVFSRYLAAELGPRGITVNAIAPGGTDTDFAGGFLRDSAMAESFSAMTALGRVGKADDPGATIASLLVAEPNWITGQRIEVSGGEHL